ncbi:MAG: triose-phosphate isomerase [Thermoproteota archaeon]|jgi:triosephosphate isomerase|nr:triose-phosphate isomerase [Thermoproteota archaeon]
MKLFVRPLIINLKNYLEIGGNDSIKFARKATGVRKKYDVDIIIAPPLSSLLAVSNITKLPVVSQHVDDESVGPTTGFIVPEIIKSCGAVGSLINHSEHKIDLLTIKNLVKRLRGLDLISIVCAADIGEVNNISGLSPDYIAIEPPELIGKGIAVSRANPSIISNSVKAVRSNSPTTRVLCGAGIINKSDVTQALDLGADGILVASGIIKSSSWYHKIEELSSAFV